MVIHNGFWMSASLVGLLSKIMPSFYTNPHKRSLKLSLYIRHFEIVVKYYDIGHVPFMLSDLCKLALLDLI